MSFDIGATERCERPGLWPRARRAHKRAISEEARSQKKGSRPRGGGSGRDPSKKLELRSYEKLKATNRCASPLRTSRSADSLASRAEFNAATASPTLPIGFWFT